MNLEEVHAEIAEFEAMLQRIPCDQNPDNTIARQIYQRLIEERQALARALVREAEQC